MQVRTGPDGALWVVDMYRFVIEHPRWISPDRLATLDVRAGHDKGRIYRVVREGMPLHSVPRASSLAGAALAEALDHPSGTVRDNVQRLLVERQDVQAVPTLRTLARRCSRPQTRAQALCALEGLGQLAPDDLVSACSDPHPGVRSHAARLAEPWLARNASVASSVVALALDADISVRYQVALTLGEWDDSRSGAALGRIAVRDRDSVWVRAAVLSSSRSHAAAVLESLLEQGSTPPAALIEPLIATLVGNGDRAAADRALTAISGPYRDAANATLPVERWRLGAVAKFLEASRDEFVGGHPAVVAAISVARRQIVAPGLATADRLAALRLLGRQLTGRDDDRRILVEALAPSEPVEVQLQAATCLLAMNDRDAEQAILRRWESLGPIVRSSCLDAFLARGISRDAVLSALERKTIPPTAIDAAHRQRLLNEGGEAERRRAQAALGGVGLSSRVTVLERFASARSLAGRPEAGRAVFTRTCATCHRVEGKGHDVGPDLAALTDTTIDALLTAILDPNREVDARYASYSVALKDGRVATGLIDSETASALTLKRQEGQVEVILRADLDELKTAGQSLMPEGLENDLSPHDVADVIAYVAAGANRPKVIDGNHPELIVARPDGVVSLTAAMAEIRGPSLTFETALGNLGMWHSSDDRAAWTFQTERPATYTLSMEWACADESAGNSFVVKVDGISLQAAVGGTGAGTWANYRTIFIGEATLPAGKHRLEFRSAGPVRQALLDLRSVVLTPRSERVFRKNVR